MGYRFQIYYYFYICTSGNIIFRKLILLSHNSLWILCPKCFKTDFSSACPNLRNVLFLMQFSSTSSLIQRLGYECLNQLSKTYNSLSQSVISFHPLSLSLFLSLAFFVILVSYCLCHFNSWLLVNHLHNKLYEPND